MYVSACSKDKCYTKFNIKPTAYVTHYVRLYIHKKGIKTNQYIYVKFYEKFIVSFFSQH